jgi:hypothetical protein
MDCATSDICVKVVSVSEQPCLTDLAGVTHEEFAKSGRA